MQARGKCILDVNLICDNKPQQIELVVPTSMINGYLTELISHTATHVKQPKNTVLIATYNKKQLPEVEFIFQSFFDQSRPKIEK